MKFLILATILAFVCISNAAQQQFGQQHDHGQQQGHQQQQQVGTGRNSQQIRQCSCLQQNQCFREWKDDIMKCSDQCRRSNKMLALKQVVQDQAKLYPCLDLGTGMVEHFLDCLNSEFTNSQSCVSNQQNLMIPYQNTNQLISTNIEPLAENLDAFLRSLIKGQQPYGNALLDVGECGRECIFNSIKRSQCFERINCGLKTSGNFLEQAANKCFRKMNFQQNAVEVCECVTKVGVNDLRQFCQTLRSTRFPMSITEV